MYLLYNQPRQTRPTQETLTILPDYYPGRLARILPSQSEYSTTSVRPVSSTPIAPFLENWPSNNTLQTPFSALPALAQELYP